MGSSKGQRERFFSTRRASLRSKPVKSEKLSLSEEAVLSATSTCTAILRLPKPKRKAAIEAMSKTFGCSHHTAQTYVTLTKRGMPLRPFHRPSSGRMASTALVAAAAEGTILTGQSIQSTIRAALPLASEKTKKRWRKDTESTLCDELSLRRVKP